MRAGSPLLSAGRRRRSSRRSLRCSPRGFPRNKSPAAAEDPRVPVLLLQDMNLCYRLLRELVPGPVRSASRVEILQRVIDYILDLQTELDADSGEPLHRDRPQQLLQRPQSGQSPGTRYQQTSEVPETDSEVEESRTLLH
ncbi:DNA-binding protein inhibitor ID-2-like [Morone saxatilis]|uniref:DNA-binding protein inhibitor ID-2-like n=1 Tax=Morone saxatilis TaxID=34816 RepID=UPI0015E1CB49|nr:DNA-binding protein inhibitor ID-2-like [Morone saxatilis]